MAKKQAGKIGTIGAVAGLVFGAILTVIAPPVGGTLLLNFVATTSAVTAVTAIFGNVIGEAVDQQTVTKRERVVQIFGPKGAGKNSVYNTITGQFIDPGPTSGTKKEDDSVPYYEATSNHKTTSKKYDVEILKNAGSDELNDKFKETKAVSGEDFPAWEKTILETNPHGIIYVVDSPSLFFRDPKQAKVQFELETKGIVMIVDALQRLEQRRITAFMILLNKIDYIDESREEPKTVLLNYRNRLLSQKSQRGTLEEIIKSVLGGNKVIRTHIFCADHQTRTIYNETNGSAIETFVNDLHPE